MQKMVWIGLSGMEFYAHHGVYEEENKIGTTFIIDIKVYTDASLACLYDDLSGTINYETLYTIVKNKMASPVKLIEYAAELIVEEIRTNMPEAEKVYIRIQKRHPPLGVKIEASFVEYEVMLR